MNFENVCTLVTSAAVKYRIFAARGSFLMLIPVPSLLTSLQIGAKCCQEVTVSLYRIHSTGYLKVPKIWLLAASAMSGDPRKRHMEFMSFYHIVSDFTQHHGSLIEQVTKLTHTQGESYQILSCKGKNVKEFRNVF